MNKPLLLIVVCSAFFGGCATVRMPELPVSHPAHPDAEAASVSAWPSILEIREEAVVAPPLPIHSEGRGVAPEVDVHRDHSTLGVDVGSALYACPMHEKVTSSSPDTCSLCGMDLVKKGGA